MSRIVSVWLKAWPIARLLNVQASSASAEATLDSRRPLVLVAPAKGGTRIVSLNRAAQRAGLTKDVLLSNARSKVPNLQVRDADPVADSDALRRLALWCLRYTPKVAPWDEASGADGLFLDIEGSAHLFGGEERLLADLAARLKAFRLVARMAIADTAGTAWAVARHSEQNGTIVASGEEMHTLHALPLAALRLGEDSQRLMHRLGLRRIGEILHQPRAPFAARFQAELLRRLDQALGHAPEPLMPVVEPPVYRAQACFTEPIMTQEHVLQAATCLLEVLGRDLERDAVGIRLLRLLLFRVDGEVQSLELGLAAPSRDAQHIAQLIGLRLYRLGNELEADFGFEAAAVHVRNAESLAERQASLGLHEDGASPEELARLIDRLQQRLGRHAVRQLHPRQSHTPERAVRVRPASPSARLLSGPSSHKTTKSIQAESKRRTGRGKGKRQISAPAHVTAPHPGLRPEEAWTETIAAPRPLLLLERPEPADVLAVVPDGPPRHFRWRGVLHQIAQAQGPERIAPEWWRHTAEGTRDYYLVEDAQGHRFWLYREGLYGQGATPQWFVHGMFA
ncbi:MAG TPA: DNA polymerase Y family protein [Hyphomicrobiaceae bacterium]|nr:DNA polymerase Y family protein [Hyphomicrobiaceae bacterium]